jgi:pimeloyl-ACP methyl ester carboxylesterase
LYLRTGKANIFYETHGRGETVLFLHGGFGSNDDFAPQIAGLSKRFKVVAFERPGHGRTADTSEPFSFNTMSTDTIDFIERLKLGPVNLVGWSDGAITALFVALYRPELVKRLVPISASFNTNALPKADIDWIRAQTPESFRKALPDLVSRYDALSPDGPGHFSIVFEKTKKLWLNEPNISPTELSKISMPTLVMAADRDAVTLEHTIELFRSIKNAELCIISRATHLLLKEKPEATTKAILDFLTNRKSSDSK